MNILYKRFQMTAHTHASKTALQWKYKKHWRRYTYGELLEIVDKVSEAMVSKGIHETDRVALFSENCPEWFISDMALNKLGAISVPIHVMSSDGYVRHALTHSESRCIILSSNLLERFQSIVSLEQRSRLFTVVIGKEDMEDSKGSFILFDDLINKSESLPKRKQEKIEGIFHSAEGVISSIVYTSGTTGDPKGVMLTDRNFISNVDAIQKRLPTYPKDIFLSILPISHVLERTAGSYMPLLHGASVAYAQGIKNLSQDLRDIQPTAIVAVPKIFERAYEKIFARIKYESLVSRKVFYWALHQLSSENRYFRKLADLLVYRKIRKKFGGQLRVAVCGGASMQPRIIRFFSQMKIFITEGYGLTETSPVVATNNLETRNIGTVGQALENVSVKIAKDKEIMVKGPSVMQGYWKNEKETQQAFGEDQWFRTGDLGFIDEKGYLTIIGRKKDIIVTSNGKNIYPEQIEMEYNLSPFVAQSLLVGHRKKFLALLVVLDIEKIKNMFGNIPDDIHIRVQQDIKKINNKLLPIERAKEIILIDEPFTLENDQLTATLKVRRKIIEAKYTNTIDAVYA